MMKTNKYFLILSLSILTITSPITSFAATDAIPFNKVNITESKAINSKDAKELLAETTLVSEDFLETTNKGNWIILDSVNYSELLTSKTGTDFMNTLYPSGIRLPTMVYDPSDTFRITLDSLPYETGNGCKLLWLLCDNAGEERFNFTLAEQRAADKYYTLMQLKSIALGLPVYSFTEIDDDTSLYTNEQQTQALSLINSFEENFGPIYFIDTSALDYDWCSQLENSSLVTKTKVLPYPLPKGSKTIHLYQNYGTYFDALQSSGTSEPPDITEFLTPNEIAVNYNKFIEDNGSFSSVDSILLTGVYYEQLPLELYDIVHIGSTDTVISNENEKVHTKTDVDTGDSDDTVTASKKEESRVNDPYFNALRNQSDDNFDSYMLNIFEEEGNTSINYKGIYQNICLIIFFVGVVVAVIIHIINKTQGR